MDDLTPPVLKVIGSVFVIGLVYIYLLNRLEKFARPLRRRLAEEAKALLESPALTPEDRRQVCFYAGNAFSVWPVVVSVLLMPFFTIALVIPSVREHFRRKTKTRMRKIAGMFMWSTVAASPLFGLILFSEYLILGLLILVTTAQTEMARSVMAALAQVENQIGGSLAHSAK